ncbi:CoxG family protein [Metabacillus schmidteae]|uniref:CoxG family protein n=1 Tax=Metabacillus schmidteae TaxID=2730405 RepID=UPI00158AB773|nr:SRPBCC family protein [Metabacillus schmidteae]
MANHLYKIEVDHPIRSIWNFVSVMDHWAPLVPGYLDHEIISLKESTWKFKTDLGVIKRKIHLKVDITAWIAPSKVEFNLTGINEKISGKGYFEAQSLGPNKTLMTGFLDITPEGALAKMVSGKLEKNLVEITEELTEAIVAKIDVRENVLR